MGSRYTEVKAIFDLAVETESPSERTTYIEAACGGDDQLRAGVEGLLKAHEEADGFLGHSPVALISPADGLYPTEGPGTVIGRYRLVEMLGEGGFGAVYMAEQEEPVSRQVALKIIKLGMNTKQVIARFEADRQALAMMDHTNIAKVHDAGATEAGRPYFVMELVRGLPITEHCDKNNLTTKDRLELFIDVCRALQHAHVKGIIHRDIKPSNVMVTLVDDRPVPKVIDFGIAKATQKRLTEKTSLTSDGQFLGTPQYMSPEQAGMSDLHVDIRTDIYSLGVLLYELLVGSTPFDPKRLREASYDEVCRIIRDTDPPTPSKQLSTLGAAAAEETSKQRQVQPNALQKQLRGDLDCIVMKTLEKDRDRRYDTAEALADDLRRFPISISISNSYQYQSRLLAGATRKISPVISNGCGIFASPQRGIAAFGRKGMDKNIPTGKRRAWNGWPGDAWPNAAA
jgi:serine/threonine protein kinase